MFTWSSMSDLLCNVQHYFSVSCPSNNQTNQSYNPTGDIIFDCIMSLQWRRLFASDCFPIPINNKWLLTQSVIFSVHLSKERECSEIFYIETITSYNLLMVFPYTNIICIFHDYVRNAKLFAHLNSVNSAAY